MDLGLRNKVIAITGGSSGIGLATVELCLQEGMKVAYCGRNQVKLDIGYQKLVANYSADNILAAVCDVLDESQVIGFADQIMRRFGGVDMLVNNAGGGRVSMFSDTTNDDWSEELALKFNSIIYPVRSFLPALRKSETASIVIVNSLLAVQPEPHMVATSAARAGVQNLVRSLAFEFAKDRIRVNSILLGTIISEQWQRRYENLPDKSLSFDAWLGKMAKDKKIPVGRFGNPEEPGRAILFLASPASSYTTGTSIDVSGGMARHI